MKGWARVPIKRIWSDFSVAFQKIIFLVIHFGIKNGKTLVSNNKYITYVGVFEQHEKLHCIAKYSNTLKEMKCTRISVFASRRGVQFFSLSNWLFCSKFFGGGSLLTPSFSRHSQLKHRALSIRAF